MLNQPKRPYFSILLSFASLLTLQAAAFAQTAWQTGVLYTINTPVNHQSSTYRCLQQHTSQIGWQPTNAPPLWQLQSGGGNPNLVFSDDFETARGWTTNAVATDTASGGVWERGDGQPTAFMGTKQLAPHNGTSSLVTGAAGGRTDQNDVDGGVTTVVSPSISLPSTATNISISFWFYFAHGRRSSSDDYFRVKIIGATSTQIIFQESGRSTNDNAVWELRTANISSFAGQTVRIQFEAADFVGESIVEAAVDDLEIMASTGGAIPGGGFPARFFAPYVDTLLYPSFPLAQTAGQIGQKYFTLSFITDGGVCEAKWGGVIGLSGNHMISDVNQLRTMGGDIIVSFGGANGAELAVNCQTAASLQAQYQAVIDKYVLTSVDFDVEGSAVLNQAANTRRNQAIASLQAFARSQNRELKVSFTLAVLPTGLDQSGVSLLQNAAASGVEISTVNIMAMDYGAVANPNTMGQNAIDATNATIAQLLTVYPNKTLSERQAMLGITPMIGLNDVVPEVFTIPDANLLFNFARTNNIGRLAMWSMTRDKQCQGSPQVSPVCSGIVQQTFDFTNIFKSLR